MNLHYNADFGYIICAETTMENTPMRVVIDPVTVLESKATSAELGEAILESLKQSRTAKPIRREEIGKYRFWHITGIKSFSAFSRKFQCISIVERGHVLEVIKLIRDSDGSYNYPTEQPPLDLPLDCPAERLGAEVASLFSISVDVPNNETLSFETIHGSIVTCRRPSDAFLDCGDGHTDAYQVFTLEGAPQNHFTFLIDNSYSELNRAAVLERWQQQYGALSDFRFHRRRKSPLIASMQGRTATAEIVSHIYQDNGGTMEVLSYIEYSLPRERQEMALSEYRAIIHSITIKSQQESSSERPVVK